MASISNSSHVPVIVTDYRLGVSPLKVERKITLGPRTSLTLYPEHYVKLEVNLRLLIPGSQNRCSISFATDEQKLLRAYSLPDCIFRELVVMRHRQIPHIDRFLARAPIKDLWDVLASPDGLFGKITLKADGEEQEPDLMPTGDIWDSASPASFGAVINWSLPKTSEAMRRLELSFFLPQTRNVANYPILLRPHSEVIRLMATLNEVGNSIDLYEHLEPARMKMLQTAADGLLNYRFNPDRFCENQAFAGKLCWA